MITNPSGKEVGTIVGDTFVTTRDVMKGQVYMVKKWFGGKKMEFPLAIQTKILNQLLYAKVQYIMVVVKNFEGRTVTFKAPLRHVCKEGVVNTERRIDGSQTVWDAAQFIVDSKQRSVTDY